MILLKVENIHTYYGQSHVLQGVSLEVDEGEIVALIGRNGVGKTTTLKSITGVQPPTSGRIVFKDEDITGLPIYEISRKGIALIPEDRRIFPNLTVYENLKMGMIGNRNRQKDSLEKVLSYFPVLKERVNQMGGSLSGGEQQMLAIARGLVSGARLLLVDEPTEGLMPIIAKQLIEIFKNLQQQEKITMLLVEQKIKNILDISDKVYIMEKGRIKFEGKSEEIRENEEIKSKYLAV